MSVAAGPSVPSVHPKAPRTVSWRIPSPTNSVSQSVFSVATTNNPQVAKTNKKTP